MPVTQPRGVKFQKNSANQTKQTPTEPQDKLPESGEIVLNRCNMFRNCPNFCIVLTFATIYILGVIFFWRIEHSLLKSPFNMLLKGSDCLPPPPLALIPARECPPIPTKLVKGMELGVSFQLGKSPALSGQVFAKGSINYLPDNKIHVRADIPFSQLEQNNIIGIEIMSRAFEIKYILGDRGDAKDSDVIGGNLDRFEAVGGWASLYRRRDLKGDTYRQFWQKAKSRDVSYYGVMEDTFIPSDENNWMVSALQDKHSPDRWIAKHIDLVLLYPSQKLVQMSARTKSGVPMEIRFTDLSIADQVTNYINIINRVQSPNATTDGASSSSLLKAENHKFHRPILVENSAFKPSWHYTTIEQVKAAGFLSFSATLSVLPEDRFQEVVERAVLVEKQLWGSFPQFHAGRLVDCWNYLQRGLQGEKIQFSKIWPGIHFLLALTLWAGLFMARISQGSVDPKNRIREAAAALAQSHPILRLCTDSRF